MKLGQNEEASSADQMLTNTRESLLQAIGVVSPKTSQPCPVYSDHPSQMTGGRLVARFLSRFSFYASPDSRERLDRAWAHYEHSTLPRVYKSDIQGGDMEGPFERATPGDTKRPTRLYPLWETPTSALGAFGISVRLYFSSLLLLSSFLGLAGFLNMGMSGYFFRGTYSTNDEEYWPAVRASAICLDTQWVECDAACQEERSAYYAKLWYDDEDGTGEKYLQKNSCDFDNWLWPGLLSYAASIMLIILFGVAFFWLQRRAEVVFDEEMQTAADYAIKVSNPPSDATDPAEWKKYMEIFGPVTTCSVALDNRKLLEKLIQRRKCLKQLSFALPLGFDMKDRTALKEAVNTYTGWKIPFVSNLPSLFLKLVELEEETQMLLHPSKPYKAVAVFVTFETQRAQRDALHSLRMGRLDVWRNRLDIHRFDSRSNQLVVQEPAESSTLPQLLSCNNDEIFAHVLVENEATANHAIQLVAPEASKKSLSTLLLFQSKHVLHVKGASEPNDVRWKDLEVPFKIRFVKYMGSTLGLIWFVAWSGFFIYDLEDSQPDMLPVFIAITNIVVPKICELVNTLEAHSTEQSRQTSLYIKVTLFRWFNSAIALTIVIGFTNTLTPDHEDASNNLTQAVFNIIYAELFTIPLIKLLDIVGFVRKHILAPRARDQEETNSYFCGGKCELSERYTDASKVLFVSLFYSAILPQSLFLGALALLIHFVVGKFCLLRTWRPAADIGASLSRLSRNYFFSTAILVHIIMSAYWWSGYPYDNLCQDGNGGYMFCNQDFLRSGVFPPLPEFQPSGSEWMTSSQAMITSLYSWTAVVTVFVGIIVFFRLNILPFCKSILWSTYEPNGKDQGINFSSVLHLYGVHGYIPQIRESSFAYPLLACDISQVDHQLVGWKDPFHDYEHHSLVEDAKEIMGGCKPEHVLFSQISHWPPPSEGP